MTARRDGTPTAQPQAARGYSRPPFEVGNLAGVRHGTRSERLVAEKAGEVRALLLERFEYLADDAFGEALERYCRIEARAVMLNRYVTELALEEGVEKVPPYLWTEATRADALAQKCAQDCGLDPTGHARIARDLGVAQSLVQRHGAARAAQLATEGRRLRELRGAS